MEGVISQDGSITISPTTNGNLIVMYAGQLPMLFVSSQIGEDSAFGQTFNVESTGVWFLHSIGEDEYTHYIEKDFSIKKIDKEFLPDDIGSSGGASGVTSWNDLEDKPFGETGFKYEWDGDINGLESLSAVPGIVLYKVSSNILSKEELIDTEYHFHFNTNDFIENINEASIVEGSNASLLVLWNSQLPVVLITAESGIETIMGMEMEIPSKGIWLLRMSDEEYVRYIEKDYSFKKIDKKYLPDDISGVGATSWNDLTDKPFGLNGWEFTYDESQTYESFSVPTMGATLYKIGEAKTKDELIGATGRYILGGSEGEFVIDESSFQDCTDNRAFVIMGDSMGLFAVSSEAIASEFMGISFEFPSAGTWNVCVDGAYTPTYLGNAVIKKIDAKYLPINLDGSVSLDNYYTKAETDSLIADIDVDVDLSNYYTKSETNNLMSNIDLSNYYTKTEMDNLIGDCDLIISSINSLVGGGSV